MSRRATAWGMLALWAAGLAWLAKRTYLDPGAAAPEAAVPNVNPGAIFLALSTGGRQVGVASTTVDTAGSDVTVHEFLLVDVLTADGVKRTTVRTTAVLTRSLRLVRFVTTVAGDLEQFSTRGAWERDSTLRVVVRVGRDSVERLVSAAQPITLPGLVPLTAVHRGAAGESLRFTVFDPVLLHAGEVRVAFGAESTFVVADSATWDAGEGRWRAARWDTVPAQRLALDGPAVPAVAWVDANGHIVQAASPAEVEFERQAFELAYDNYRRARPAALPSGSGPAILFASPVPARGPTAPESLVVVLDGGIGLPAAALAGGTQERRGDTVIVHRGRVPPRFRPAPARDRLPESMLATADPRVQAASRQATAGERAAAATRRLVAWIEDNLRGGAVGGPLTAAQVLESRRGGSNEHAVLFVALAEAAGLRARPVAGLLYDGEHLHYRAWAEVWLGEWIPVDPALGQFPADAWRVRLAAGRLARPTDLVDLVGTLRLRIL